MEHDGRKRIRDELEKVEDLRDQPVTKNAKKFHECKCVDECSSSSKTNKAETKNDGSYKSNMDVDSFRVPANICGGVFDFPWLKEDPIFTTTTEFLEEFGYGAIVSSDYFYFSNEDDDKEQYYRCNTGSTIDLDYREDDNDIAHEIDKSNIHSIWGFVLDQPLDNGSYKL